ncbi:MAG: PRC-barrel domain-containing protein [Candidatus Methanoplasma sp.]|jgi:sporulation protein YlmC with PRC-barrel domain|nr:PRC-barrel domain-containing protein [Candidatus Methanoplasma sp.]
MLESVGNIIGLEIYTPEGLFVGVADEVVIDVSSMRASGIYVERANPAVVDEGVSISIPMRWVRGVGDVIILSSFPQRVERPS